MVRTFISQVKRRSGSARDILELFPAAWVPSPTSHVAKAAPSPVALARMEQAEREAARKLLEDLLSTTWSGKLFPVT